MNGTQRRAQILEQLKRNPDPLSGSRLAKDYGVSRQVIVQDIALLRANGADILSTNRGYVLYQSPAVSRVFKVRHSDEEVGEELCLIVDCGGIIEDIFVFHKVYGTVRAQLNIRSREDVRLFLEQIASGKSSLLKNITSGYHYHTVQAASESILDLIREKLDQRGFLAPLQDYEPVNFNRQA